MMDPRSESNLAGVNAHLADCVRLAIASSQQIVRCTFGVRTAAQQAALYAIGRTKPGKIVTFKDGYKNPSNHQVTSDGTGHAVDLTAFNADGSPNWTTGTYAVIYAAMFAAAETVNLAQYGWELRSGSDWNMNGVRCEHGETDLGHFELHPDLAKLPKSSAALAA